MNVYHLKQIPSEAKITKFLKKILFGDHLFCPECKSWDVVVFERRYRCKRCKIKFSVMSHTWLSNLKIPLQQFWLILWCWTNQIPVKQTQRLASISEKGTRHWFDLFRAHLPQEKELLEHIIQLDEVYLGGWGGFALLLGKQKGTRKLAYDIIPTDSVNRTDALNFLRAYVRPQSRLNTDGSAIYEDVDRWYPVIHESEIHQKFEFTKTSEVEGMFGVLKTFIRRMYHHVTPAKFPKYMCEFYYRFCRPEMFKSPHYYLTKTLSIIPTG
jgi:transposase-like protein